MNATSPRDKNTTNQIVGTPREFIAAVEKRFGNLHCDVCANRNNHKAPLYIADPKTYDAALDNAPRSWGPVVALDGLLSPWHEPGPVEWLWMNPQFKDTPEWIKKIHLERKRILVLVLASVGAVWYRELVEGKAAVFFLSPRLTFEGESHPYPKDLMLLAFDFDALDRGLLNTQPHQWRWKPGRGEK